MPLRVSTVNHRSLALVFGYLKDIDYPNDVAKRLGFNKRFAIAIDTYRPDLGYMFFDVELLFLILSSVLKAFKFTSIEIQLDEGNKKSAASLNELREVLYEEPDEELREPFNHMKVRAGDEICCYVQTEFYTRIGGPDPYHDTYTFSFYVDEYERPALQNNIYQICAANNIIVREIRTGYDTPVTALWAKIKRFLA